ncbi:MAG TPA: tripartite tricarboxylate transporter TctB family protein [Casimicrobiaceae bacterium]|nr:tripartite tricarboxylate transporter TctB family protein [Casimicrobiaceae bacterium]
MAKIPRPKDFYAGLLFVAFGVFAIVIARNYPLGTAARMGPGYFPRLLGILLVVLGAALSLTALRGRGPALPGWKWRPVSIVLLSVVAFGLVLTHAGLVLSTIGLIVVASTASREFRLKESLLSGILLAALSVGVFVIGLKLQLPIWPGSG